MFEVRWVTGFGAGLVRGSGLAGNRGRPGVAGEQGVQDVEDVAGRACGRCRCSCGCQGGPGWCRRWSAARRSSAGSYSGRSPDSLMLFVGHTSGVGGESQDVGFAVAAELEHVPAGVLFRAVPGAGDAGHVGQGDGDRAAEQLLQGFADGGGDRGQAVAAGLVAGVDQRAEGFLRLGGPDLAGVGFRAVLQVTKYVAESRPGGRRCSSMSCGSSCRTGQ